MNGKVGKLEVRGNEEGGEAGGLRLEAIGKVEDEEVGGWR